MTIPTDVALGKYGFFFYFQPSALLTDGIIFRYRFDSLDNVMRSISKIHDGVAIIRDFQYYIINTKKKKKKREINKQYIEIKNHPRNTNHTNRHFTVIFFF